MTLDEARSCLARNARAEPGRFYGAAVGLSLGKGVIYNDVAYPAFDDIDLPYATLSGEALVLTHECDVAVENDRLYNELVLICPIIKVEEFVAELEGTDASEEYKSSFLQNLAARNISRLLYLPPCDLLPSGGIVYLNQITHSHVSCFDAGAQRCALSAFGLRDLEYVLENHLLRPKDERLGLQP